MYKQSIGLIETIGLTCGVVAADVAVKTANVQLIGYELTKGNGMVTVKIAGDVGSVNAAVDAAVKAANEVGKVFSAKVIPRLGDNVDKLIFTEDTIGYTKNVEKVIEQKTVEPKDQRSTTKNVVAKAQSTKVTTTKPQPKKTVKK